MGDNLSLLTDSADSDFRRCGRTSAG